MSVLVLYTRIQLHDGTFATGPVRTTDFNEFLFKNTGSSLDLYFTIKKNGENWILSGGMDVPAAYIEQLGQKIDRELVVK